MLSPKQADAAARIYGEDCIMSKRRCPWCGKILTDEVNQYKLNSKTTPKPLYFGKCANCGKFSAQMYSLRELIMFIIAAVMCILICIINYRLMWLGIFVLGGIVIYAVKTARIRRTDETEEYLVPEAKVYTAEISPPSIRLYGEPILPTSPDFDNSPSYSTSSPIRLVKINRKRKTAQFYFLYEHKDNAVLLSEQSFSAFDDNGNRYTFNIIQ